MAKRSRPDEYEPIAIQDETGKHCLAFVPKKGNTNRPMTPAEARLIEAAIKWEYAWQDVLEQRYDEAVLKLGKAVAAVVKERAK